MRVSEVLMQWDELTSIEKEKKLLQVLANERDKNPNTGFVLVDERDLGAKLGAFVDAVFYETSTLEDKGLVRRLRTKNGNKVMITDKGYHLVRPMHRGICFSYKSHMRAIIVGIIIAVIAGLIIAIITGAWHPW